VLVNDVAEFLPYVFQLLAVRAPRGITPRRRGARATQDRARRLSPGPQRLFPRTYRLPQELLDLRPAPNVAAGESALTEAYKSLLPPLLNVALWTRKANVPALSSLLCAYLRKGGVSVTAANALLPVLGIFQKLLSTRGQEDYAFDVLTALSEWGGRAQQEEAEADDGVWCDDKRRMAACWSLAVSPSPLPTRDRYRHRRRSDGRRVGGAAAALRCHRSAAAGEAAGEQGDSVRSATLCSHPA
jgi:hypothetical protein